MNSFMGKTRERKGALQGFVYVPEQFFGFLPSYACIGYG